MGLVFSTNLPPGSVGLRQLAEVKDTELEHRPLDSKFHRASKPIGEPFLGLAFNKCLGGWPAAWLQEGNEEIPPPSPKNGYSIMY